MFVFCLISTSVLLVSNITLHDQRNNNKHLHMYIYSYTCKLASYVLGLEILMC